MESLSSLKSTTTQIHKDIAFRLLDVHAPLGKHLVIENYPQICSGDFQLELHHRIGLAGLERATTGWQ
jgi:hypothetical protein